MKKLILLTLLLSCNAPAAAAPEADYSIDETRRMMYDYGRCIVKLKTGLAAEVILLNLDTATIMDRHRKLTTPDCLVKAAPYAFSVQMRLPGDMFRYTLADALVTEELSTVIPQNLSSVPLLDHLQVDEAKYSAAARKRLSKRRAKELAEAHANAIVYAYFSRFGECVVRKDAAKAHALLMTRPTTLEENKAFAALVPVFGSCLEAGRQFSANRMMMRGMVAINYYRLAKASLAPTKGQG